MSPHFSSTHLPANPNLEHLKKQAKKLVKDHKAGQVDAFGRIKASFPRLSNASVQEILADDFTLCNAQLVIAHEYGFATWKALVEAVTTYETASVEDTLVSENPSLIWTLSQVKQAAAVDLPVLVVGESGTGKGLIARTIHQLSTRKNEAFVQTTCCAELDIQVESDLFGHEKGAFTGAHARRKGKVETTQRGTLFLDEVGDLSLGMQAKLLRFLETGTFERHGGEVLQSDVRVIAATLRDLETMVAAGTFHQDLALLLQKIQINIPPLRERQEDILRLATHFIKQMAGYLKKEVPRLSTEVEVALQQYDWPGNLKELEHRVQRAVVICEGAVIQKEDIVL